MKTIDTFVFSFLLQYVSIINSEAIVINKCKEVPWEFKL